MPPVPTMSASLLAVHDLYAGYQDFDILQGVDLEVATGEIVCVIGPNGAGKATVFKAIYGLIPVRQGTVQFDGKEITNARPQDLLRAGVAIVPPVAQRLSADDGWRKS